MLKINWENRTRQELLQHLVDTHGYRTYLEIGCDKNQVFNGITVESKIGVDPVRGGTIRMTSDEFFASVTGTWDLIFIDGLHEYSQVSRDVENALSRLNNGGTIVIHDMLPTTEGQTGPVPTEKYWLGDVWRLAFDLAGRGDIDFRVLTFDFGCGIIRRGVVSPLDLTVEPTWEFYSQNYHRLPLTTWTEYFHASV